MDVVIVRDIDRLTRNLTDWNAFEKAYVRHGVRLSACTGGDLDLSTAKGAYYGRMETLRVRRERAAKRAPGPGALFKTPCDREEEKRAGGIECVMVSGVRTAIVGVEHLPVLEMGYEPLDRCAKR